MFKSGNTVNITMILRESKAKATLSLVHSSFHSLIHSLYEIRYKMKSGI